MKPVAALGVLGMLCPAVLCVAQTPGATEAIRIETAARSIQPGELVLFTAHLTTPVQTLRVRCLRPRHPGGSAWKTERGRPWSASDLNTSPCAHPVRLCRGVWRAGPSGPQPP